jgi:hypothetical protein
MLGGHIAGAVAQQDRPPQLQVSTKHTWQHPAQVAVGGGVQRGNRRAHVAYDMMQCDASGGNLRGLQRGRATLAHQGCHLTGFKESRYFVEEDSHLLRFAPSRWHTKRQLLHCRRGGAGDNHLTVVPKMRRTTIWSYASSGPVTCLQHDAHPSGPEAKRLICGCGFDNEGDFMHTDSIPGWPHVGLRHTAPLSSQRGTTTRQRLLLVPLENK